MRAFKWVTICFRNSLGRWLKSSKRLSSWVSVSSQSHTTVGFVLSKWPHLHKAYVIGVFPFLASCISRGGLACATFYLAWMKPIIFFRAELRTYGQKERPTFPRIYYFILCNCPLCSHYDDAPTPNAWPWAPDSGHLVFKKNSVKIRSFIESISLNRYEAI